MSRFSPLGISQGRAAQIFQLSKEGIHIEQIALRYDTSVDTIDSVLTEMQSQMADARRFAIALDTLAWTPAIFAKRFGCAVQYATRLKYGQDPLPRFALEWIEALARFHENNQPPTQAQWRTRTRLTDDVVPRQDYLAASFPQAHHATLACGCTFLRCRDHIFPTCDAGSAA